ncbi:MAG: SDR family oxidoreductase [Patescibacteria group bacterium]
MKKIALVTAASKGIGAATAIAFAKVGYDVIINYKSDEAAAKNVALKAKEHGVEATVIQADVFTEQGVKKLYEFVSQKYKKIDTLVNNAGYADEPEFGKLTQADVVNSLSANFISAVLCTQAFYPVINKGGSILFNSSVYGMNLGGNPGLSIYSAGKAAIANFAQTMAERLAPDIRCNVVSPGVTKTPAWDGASEAYIKMRLEQSLQKEWVNPEDIGNAFVFLAENPHMNAATVIVDAGWMKKFPEK